MTRILWLRGEEPQNARAYRRYIYIHGTPEERNIGMPASYGCVRMRSRDVIELYNMVGRGRAGNNRERAARIAGAGASTPVADRFVLDAQLLPLASADSLGR